MLASWRGLSFVGLTCLAGCGGPSAPPPPASTAPQQAAAPRPSPLSVNPSLVSLANAAPESLQPAERDNLVGAAIFRNTCALCHGPGIAGAPRLDHHEAWKPRLEAGIDTLYRHAIEGFRGSQGLMPPRGGNPSLSDDEVRSAVDYMVSRSLPTPPDRPRAPRPRVAHS